MNIDGLGNVKEAVRSRYADAARRLMVTESDPSADCCGPGSASLGCGNPTALAELKPGEVVLDLGSGAGLDVLMAARRVGPGGHAYGVDMTDEMLELAERNREKAGIPNATFLRGTIENVPLPDASVDVVISNCVINLAEDKGAVIKEAFRVLRPGGRFAVADMVELEPLHPSLKTQLDSWAGCISGTISIDEYRAALVAAGFAEPEFEVHDTQALPGVGKVGSAHIRALKPAPA